MNDLKILPIYTSVNRTPIFWPFFGPKFASFMQTNASFNPDECSTIGGHKKREASPSEKPQSHYLLDQSPRTGIPRQIHRAHSNAGEASRPVAGYCCYAKMPRQSCRRRRAKPSAG